MSRVQSQTLEAVRTDMNDPTNWVSLLGSFRYEKALSDYIANYPNRLEDGLLPHPNSKIRERVPDSVWRCYLQHRSHSGEYYRTVGIAIHHCPSPM